ncbi:uncharacterized protein I303_101985 [Kwoniella dejecticola CBS 10117]|uniref:Uncharacterized protein n=1 Tax=Kwoniella dejecticola CBS 10117 TaxID=1296121 RepID=A0A1A6AC93_9TREE|nr:uncharacterized protein I303_01878 [Kwoniella dejecticola CBS 10117]OBR87670.1 hypothetical protein I303_01878 [Kwoniella dejecticola CBS 10117]
MDLSTLGSTLPPGLADAERDMGDKFRAAALSITNLYKSSLGYTKQAYNVGYSAALADVLSTVQSSIGAGQDAEQALSRLMDWAEARQAAISAFAAEDTDEPAPAPPTRRPIPAFNKSALSHNPPNRPASAGPTFASAAAAPSSSSSTKLKEEKIDEGASPIAGSSRSIPPIASTPNTIDSPLHQYQPTPSGVMSSSPMASPSNHHTRPSFNHLPKSSKNASHRHTYTSLNLNQNNNAGSASSSSTSNSTSNVPSTTFNPSIPHAGIPFVSFTQPTSLDSVGPAQNYSTGSKRPMIDAMEIDQVQVPVSIPIQTNNNATATATVQIQTPTTTNRSGRASKRRSLGTGLGNNGSAIDADEKDKDKEKESGRDKDKRKGGRRHGNGGASAV